MIAHQIGLARIPCSSEALLQHDLNPHDLPFTKDIAVVCEEFEVVYP